jgi:CheY-like chemotaxis protein
MAFTPLRVLVVDDEPDVTDTLSAIMRLEKLEVDTANDGFRGLEIAKTKRPLAVVLDIGMPGMSGLEFAKRLRQLPEGDRLLIVAISGQYVTSADRANAVTAGIDLYFTKPADPWTLIQVLKQQLAS